MHVVIFGTKSIRIVFDNLFNSFYNQVIDKDKDMNERIMNVERISDGERYLQWLPFTPFELPLKKCAVNLR